MPAVVLERVSLSGFGCYQSTVQIDFPAGLVVLAGPNEVGKSTLIAGITALFFGLSNSQDKAAFSQGRWQNWQHPAKFSGELYLRVDGVQWQLTRDFADNRVSLRQRLGESWREVAQGVDNPGARRPLQRYHEQLQRLLGVQRRELWQAAFCLTQPLPAPAALDEAVQSLLTGADSQVSKVQQRLEQQVRSLTRHYGEALGSGRGGNRDRQLEELQLEMEQLEQAIVRGQGVADGLQAVQAELLQVERERAETASQLQIAQQLVAAWTDWRSYQERYQRQLTSQQQLESALVRAKELQAELGRCSQALRQYADMAIGELDWSGKLTRLAKLQAKQLETEQRMQATRSELQAAQAELGPSETVQGQDPPPVAEAWPAAAEDARLAAQTAAVRRLQARLASEFRLLEEAAPGELAKLAIYQSRQLELWGQAREAERAFMALREREQACLNAEAAWRAQYGSLPPAPERLLLSVNQRLQQLGSQEQAKRSKAPTALGGLGPWLLAGLAVGSVYWLFGQSRGPIGSLAALLAGLLAWALATRLSRKQPGGGEAATAVPNGLGSLAALGWSELLTARDLLERLSKAQAERPGDQLLAAEADREAVASELAAFLRDLAPFTAAFPDLETAYRQWLELRQELRLAQGDLTATAKGIRLGAEQEAASRRAAAKLRLRRAEQQLQELTQSAEQLQQAWDEELLDIAASWQLAGNLDKLKERYQSCLEWQQQSAAAQQMQAEILALFGADSLEGMQRQQLDLQNGIASLQLGWQALIDRHPGLPTLREADQAERMQLLFRASEARSQELRAVSLKQQARVEQLWRQQASLEGQSPSNIASTEERHRLLLAEQERLQLEVAALGLAYRELAAAKEEFETVYREELSRQASRYFDQISGAEGRRVELGPDFRVTLFTAAGREILPIELSQGARDQLYLALRLAIADLLADQRQLPLVLDDPFVNSDAQRLQQIRQALTTAGVKRQILLFSHQPALLEWGKPVCLQ